MIHSLSHTLCWGAWNTTLFHLNPDMNHHLSTIHAEYDWQSATTAVLQVNYHRGTASVLEQPYLSNSPRLVMQTTQGSQRNIKAFPHMKRSGSHERSSATLHTANPSSREAETSRSLLGYSGVERELRTTRDTKNNLISRKQNNNRKSKFLT